MDLNPRDYRAWYGLGQTYELLHMPAYALHYYQRATQVPAHACSSNFAQKSGFEQWLNPAPCEVDQQRLQRPHMD